MFDIPVLSGSPALRPSARPWRIERADTGQTSEYRRLRREVFVSEQGLFQAQDTDWRDEDPRTVVLVAVGEDRTVLGGVRLSPANPGRDIGWWTGSRLVVSPKARRSGGIGPELVRQACIEAVTQGVLRFEATVQKSNEPLFSKLGWVSWGTETIGGMEHVRMRWPIHRLQDLVATTKTPLGELLGSFTQDHPSGLGGAGFIGDDGAPVPGSEVVAACDAILPGMITRDPEWAGWCSVLVNINDLSAMGATPLGLLDSLGAPTQSLARRMLNGLRAGAQAWGVPVLGGHTQIGVPVSLSVTALGHASRPVPAGGAVPGHALSLTADLHGQWRNGFEGRQWDSTSTRSAAELQHLTGLVPAATPAAAKDVSMAGIVGTTAMMCEASGTGAVLDVAAVPTPEGANMGDWLTCFPGYAMVTADSPGGSRISSSLAVTAECGHFTPAPGVRLRWPDGVETHAVPEIATGLGRATLAPPDAVGLSGGTVYDH